MKLSIIVPVYNTSKYLKECLNSLLKQTIKDYEIIVIDDGSTDNSLDIIKEFNKKHPKILKYKSIPNKGVSNARNIGLSMAQGEYIGFVDSDDYVSNSMFLKLYNKAINENADIVECGYNKVYNGKIESLKVKNNDVFDSNILKKPNILCESASYCWLHIFKKELIDKNKISFENYTIFEDLLFTYKAFKHANKIVKVFEPLYYYRLRDDESSVTQGFSKKYNQLFDVMNELKKYYNNYIPQKYLTFLAIKHTFVRFRTNVKFRLLFRKYKFIKDSYKFLNKFDSLWKENFYFDTHIKSKHFSITYWVIIPYIRGYIKK